mgnify:CR=1 FL=1
MRVIYFRARMTESGVSKPCVFLRKTKVFRHREIPCRKYWKSKWFSMSTECVFAKRRSKLFINDSVYKVFRLPFFDTAKPRSPYGKVRSRNVAESHQGIVKSLMLFDRILCTFPERALKSYHKRQCL